MLDVSEAVRHTGVEFPFQAVQAIAPQEIQGEAITFDDAQVSGRVCASADGSIHVTGSLKTCAHARCANCLKAVDQGVTAGFDEIFYLNGDPEDDEIFAYTGQEISLEKLAMSCAVLELPMRFLCREDCPGQEGIDDRDVRVYLCQEELPGQRPFAALQQLLSEQTEDRAD